MPVTQLDGGYKDDHDNSPGFRGLMVSYRGHRWKGGKSV